MKSSYPRMVFILVTCFILWKIASTHLPLALGPLSDPLAPTHSSGAPVTFQFMVTSVAYGILIFSYSPCKEVHSLIFKYFKHIQGWYFYSSLLNIFDKPFLLLVLERGREKETQMCEGNIDWLPPMISRIRSLKE